LLWLWLAHEDCQPFFFEQICGGKVVIHLKDFLFLKSTFKYKRMTVLQATITAKWLYFKMSINFNH